MTAIVMEAPESTSAVTNGEVSPSFLSRTLVRGILPPWLSVIGTLIIQCSVYATSRGDDHVKRDFICNSLPSGFAIHIIERGPMRYDSSLGVNRDVLTREAEYFLWVILNVLCRRVRVGRSSVVQSDDCPKLRHLAPELL